MLLEVFPLNDTTRERRLYTVNEALNEGVVLGTTESWRSASKIIRVSDQFAVVGANIKRDWKRPRWLNSRSGGVERKLADWDAHAANAKVAEAEDALVVGDNDQANLCAAGGVAQQFRNSRCIFGRNPCAACATPDLAPALARLADGGRVDDWQELFDILNKEAIEEGLVAVLQRSEADVALERVLLSADLDQLHGDLLLEGQDRRREEPVEAEEAALLTAEGGVLIQRWPAEQRLAALLHRKGGSGR